VALDWATLDEAPVVALGGAAAEAGGALPADPRINPSTPQATNTITAATRVLRILPPFVSVQYLT
jgi:hypothetical protein